MTPEEWRETKAVLAEALELPADQRAALLDLRCGGNPVLRREVESLLSASDEDGFLDSGPRLPDSAFLALPALPALPATPAITPGEVLGPYKIEKKLAEGGMGEVYQAFDSRLERRVAIKVLPARLSQEASALIRFERETKALAALSHPNILTIFDVGRNGETAFAVTELLTGSTLRQRLARGKLPVPAAVELAAQAARGLAAAHAEGIVHRDLKPENLFLTAGGSAGGTIKILDFGIAFTSPRPGSSSSPLRLTVEHSVIGTARYMSPEQARGESCDPRSDIFSLGAVLYEMLAGSPAFPGETPLAALLAVVELDPVPLGTLCPSASPQLVRLVHRCLDKEPARRFQSASDLAFHLETLAEAPTSPETPKIPAAPVGRRRGLLRAGTLAGLLLAAAFFAGLAVQQRWGRSDPPRFHRLTFRRGHVANARFAPDGQTIVYSASWDGQLLETFAMRTDSPESRSLGLPPSHLHSISTKGEMLIGLVQTRNGSFQGYTLARVPLAGGAPRPILEGRGFAHWADWGPGGDAFALLRFAGDRSQIEYPRGKVIWSSEPYAWDLRVAPGGDALGFCEDRGGWLEDIVILDRAGKVVARSNGWSAPPYQEFTRHGCVAWGPAGKEIWFAAAHPGKELGLYALSRGGKVRPLLRVPGDMAVLDVARDGRVLLTQVNRRSSVMAQAPGETQERNLSWFDSSELADLSADGRFVLFTETGQGGGERTSAYLRATDGSPAVRLGDGLALALSPDGRWALARSATDLKRLYLLPTGAGEPRALPPTSMDVLAARWMPGGRQLVIYGTEPGKGSFRLYLMDIGARGAHPFTRAGIEFFALSPDGSKVAARGPDGVTIYPVGGGEPSSVSEALWEEQPIEWRADGRALYLARFQRGFRVIDEVDLATGRRRRWKDLGMADGSTIWNLLMTPNGRAYAYDVRTILSTLYLVEGLR